MTLPRLRRMQWILRAALAFALMISMATNILHAEQDLIAQGVAGWSPLALFVAIEVMMRVPVHSKFRAGLRIVATASIAGIAAWTSYWHMVGVVARYEQGEVPYLLPISVDGLIIVLSVSLLDVASQIREHLDAAPAVEATLASPAVETVRNTPTPPSTAATAAADTQPTSEAAPHKEPAEPGPHDEDQNRDGHDGEHETDDEDMEPENRPGLASDLAPDLVPLLPAARAARDELLGEGATVSRDALAQRLRRNGTPLRNTRVSELLAALKAESGSVNGSRPKASV
ncbi:DUF2637 domain-containing protein [Micromonospora aurantiaca (nom. illeg.)]|uniref:DUF2637 domain-containing protein n=1 Tax=Micromonospora aurantiaca (nom. illeg.) TaxID=47850 RepID=UPI0033DA46C0